MNTEICIFVEVKVKGLWVLYDDLELNPNYSKVYPLEHMHDRPHSVYSKKNPGLFAILADVGNPYCAETPFDLIAPVRGLPEDLSPELFEWSRTMDLIWNDSWFTLSELRAFDWAGKTIVRKAMVDKKHAGLFTDPPSGFPYEQWPQDEAVEYFELVNHGKTVRWVETYRDTVGKEFFSSVIQFRFYTHPDDVRFVFWFSR